MINDKNGSECTQSSRLFLSSDLQEVSVSAGDKAFEHWLSQF